MRIRLQQLLHRLFGNTERSGIHHVATPQRHISHAAITEVAEILHIPFQADHLTGKTLTIVVKPLQFEVAQRKHGREHHRHGNQHDQRKIADHAKIHYGKERQNRGADTCGERSPTACRSGTQHGEFATARIRKLFLILVALRPIGEILVHLFQIEHWRTNAFGRLHQQVERGTFALAQRQRLRVIEHHRQYHDGAGFACITRTGWIIGNQLRDIGIVRPTHINAPIHGGRPRVNGDCSTRSEREYGSRHFSARQCFRMLVVNDIQQFCGAGRTHFRFITPILDVTVVLRTIETAQCEHNGDHTQHQADHSDGDPCDQANTRFCALPVTPLLFLLCFAFHKTVFDGGITSACHTAGRTDVKHGNHVNIVAGTNVVHGELQRPFITTFGDGRAFGVQPSP